MNRRILPVIVVACLVLGSLAVPFIRSKDEQIGFISIKQDGTVEPSSAPVQRAGNVYTFTDNINKPIVVERGNITIDGAGHWLQRSANAPNVIGIDSGVGINLTCSYVTVRNTHISGWNAGILGAYDSNKIVDNSITGCYTGIKVYGNDYSIEWNYIANNDDYGIILRANRAVVSHNEIAGDQNGIDISYSDHLIMENNMSNTGYDITGLGIGGVSVYRNNFFKTAPSHYLLAVGGSAAWDNGKQGNYWKAYNGTDADGDGIGDTPYSIGQFYDSGSRIWGIDNHPLMKPVTIQKPPQPSPVPNPTPTPTPLQSTPSPSLTPLPSPTASPSATPTPLPTTPPAPSSSPTVPELPAWTILTLTLAAALIIIANRFNLKAKRAP